MKVKLFFQMFIVGIVLVSCMLSSASFAQAFQTWTGDFSFAVNSTSQETDNSGNDKFFTSKQSFEGTLSLFTDQTGLTKSGECFLTFEGTDGTTICITKMAGISTESQKSKSEKILLVGLGRFSTAVEGTPVTGIAYIDLKGTLKQDSSGFLLSIALGGKIGGGVNVDNDNFVFNATLNNTILTKYLSLNNY